VDANNAFGQNEPKRLLGLQPCRLRDLAWEGSREGMLLSTEQLIEQEVNALPERDRHDGHA
jgi:hypothetical protein